MNIYLGNLKIEEIEKRTGVQFPKKLKEFMKERHQEIAENIQDGKWHCFDIPFTIVCGDYDTASTIYNYLKEFNSEFKEKLAISIQKK